VSCADYAQHDRGSSIATSKFSWHNHCALCSNEKSNGCAPGGIQVWRVMGNVPEPVKRLTRAEPAGCARWISSFQISHRINARLRQDGVYFVGDAAHVHSPIGARGMNLGIEDAWVFSELVKRNEMARYEELRKKIDGHVVNRIAMLSRIARDQSVLFRFVRSVILPKAVEIGSIH
jgi:2-polyprenyl-6-methoxyphenol hydroxylase-like FAD-dependent oxidoreductase